MKIIRICSIIFIIYNFIDCQAKKGNNVMLTDFTKELISLYINDVKNLDAKNKKDEIIIIFVADTSYYYLSVFANNNKEHRFCRNDFVGQTLYLGHLIRVFGNGNSKFYSVINEIKKQKKCKEIVTEYDPSIWQVCFYRNLSLCKARTYKTNIDENISAIQNLAEKYFDVSDTTTEKNDNEIYQSHEIENNPRFLLGEDNLRHLISSNFEIKSNNIQGKTPVVVDILIDKNGKATLSKISKSSNNTEIDNEALRVAEIVCQYEFVPASHRGEKVNAIFPVVFLKNDIVP